MEQSDSKALVILQSLDGKYVKRWAEVSLYKCWTKHK